MANFNKVLIMGNLTRDVELRNTQGGLAIAKFGMAVNRKVKDKESVCFVDLTAWGQQAETLAQYVGKGSPLFVEGRLEYSQWEDKDGNKRSKLEVVVESFQFIGGKTEEQGAGRSLASRSHPPKNEARKDWTGDSEVPF